MLHLLYINKNLKYEYFFITDKIPFKGKSGSSVIIYTWINYFLKKKHKVIIFIYPSRTVNLDKFF